LIAQISGALAKASETIMVLQQSQASVTRKVGGVPSAQRKHGTHAVAVSKHASTGQAPCVIHNCTVTLDVGMIVRDTAALVKATWTTMEPLPRVRAPDIVLDVLQGRHKGGTRWKIVIMNVH